jgi:hypothetical protein
MDCRAEFTPCQGSIFESDRWLTSPPFGMTVEQVRQKRLSPIEMV